MTRATRRKLERAMPWLVILAALITWEAGCAAFGVRAAVLPRPSVIAVALWHYRAIIMIQLSHTLLSTLIGFALAVLLGLLLGAFIGSSSLAYSGLYGPLVGFNSVPKVALIPVFVIWFGIGLVPAVLTAFALSFFPIVVNVSTGVATIEPEMRDVLRSLRAREDQILLTVGLPRALPYFFGSLKIAISSAFVGTITSETIASNYGIGYLMIDASSQFNVPLVFAALLVVGFCGVLLYQCFSFIEQRMTGWARTQSHN
jgi:NitT/TauT family transport system permease protein